MPRSMDAVQAERAGRSHIAVIPMVKLTRYSNHLTSTVRDITYFSTVAVDYDYGNTGTNQRFLPFLTRGSDFFSGIVHVPQPDDLTAFHQSFDIRLSNVENYKSAFRLADILTAGAIVNSDVEVSRLYVDSIDSLPVDLTSYDGDEHLVLLRGRVSHYSATDSTFTLHCETVIPTMAEEWIYAKAGGTPARDFGKRLPRIYGNAKRTPVIAYDVGGVTTLAKDINNSQTGAIECTDGLVFPSGTFGVRIDDEATITCTARSASTFTISVRGSGATSHEAGSAVIELADPSTYIVSDSPAKAINAIYFINPINQQLTRLDSGASYYPTVDLADTFTISGRTVASFAFTAAEMTSLLTKFNISGAFGNPGGYDLVFFADVDGIPIPIPDDVFVIVEDFESGTWSVLNCTASHSAAQKFTGTNSLEVVWNADALAIVSVFTANNLTGWDAIAATLLLDATEGHRAGNSNALEASASSAAANALVWWDDEYYQVLHAFESGSWNAFNCAAAINSVQPRNGTNALEIIVDVDAEAASSGFSTTSTADWTAVAHCTIATASSEGERGGASCIEITRTGTVNSSNGSINISGDIDLSVDQYNGGRGLLVLDVKFKKVGAIAGTIVTFFWGDTASDYASSWFNMDDFSEDTWYTLILNWDTESSGGSPDFSVCDYLQFFFGEQTSSINTQMYIDNIKFIKEDAIVQNNAMGSADFSAGLDLYRAYSYHDAETPLPPLFLDGNPDANLAGFREIITWISKNTWGTTVIGSDYRRCRFEAAETVDAYIETDQDSFTDVGAQDETDIDSMRITARLLPGQYTRDPIIKHYFDDYSGNTTVAPPSYDFGDTTYQEGRTGIIFDFKIKKAGTTGTIQFRFGTDEDNYYHTSAIYDTDDFTEDTWVTLFLTTDGASQFGSPDEADINMFGCEFNQANRSTSCKVYFDNIKIVANECVAQNNALGGTGVDMSTFSEKHRFQYYIDLAGASDPINPQVFFWMSKNSWGGTTIGSDYQWGGVSPAHTEDTWLEQIITSTSEVGDGTLTDVDTLRLHFHNKPGLYARNPITKHYIDTWKTNNPVFIYSGTPGDSMTHPADIFLHFITTIGGETIASGDVAALVTALGASLEFGFDMRTLGFKWDEIVQRMAFEARTNVFPIEEVTGRAWRLAAADATYGFGSGTVDGITQVHNASVTGRNLNEVGNYFSFRYAYDPSMGSNSEEGFASALVCSPNGSDVPISAASMTAAAVTIDKKEIGLIAFRCIQDANTAQEIAGYYVQENSDEDRYTILLREVAWFDALLWNIGDVITLFLPWKSGESRARIIAMSLKDQENTWDITLAVVRSIGLHT